MKFMQKRRSLGGSSFPRSKAEMNYLIGAKEALESGKHNYIASSPKSPTNGFEMLFGEESEMVDPPEKIRMFSYKAMRYMISMMRTRSRSFKDLLQNEEVIDIKVPEKYNQELWEELNKYALEKWGIKKIGFTHIPPELIFNGRYISHPYALIFIEEMRKDRIVSMPSK